MGFWDQLKKAASGRRLLDSIDAVEDAVRSTDRGEALRLAKEDYQRRGALLDPKREAYEVDEPEEAPPEASPEIDEEPPPTEAPQSTPRMGAPNAPLPFELPTPLNDPQTEERFYEVEISEDDSSLPPFAETLVDPMPEITLESLHDPLSGEHESLEFDEAETFIRTIGDPDPFDDEGEPTTMMETVLAPLEDVNTADLVDPDPISSGSEPEPEPEPEEADEAPAPQRAVDLGALEAAARYPNSLGLSDRDVVRILRDENYPHLDEVRDEDLCALSRLEAQLVERAETAGAAFHALQRGALDERPLWLAALWFTGMHRDPMIREGLRRLDEERSPQAARWLGWAIWPYASELRGASAGADDPEGVRASLDALEEALGERESLIRCSNPQMSVELHRFPVALQGVFRRRGFRWLPSS